MQFKELAQIRTLNYNYKDVKIALQKSRCLAWFSPAINQAKQHDFCNAILTSL
jgi:hypothetical protein